MDFSEVVMIVLSVLLALAVVFACVIIIVNASNSQNSSIDFIANETNTFIYNKDGVLYLYNGHNVVPYIVYADGQLYGAIYRDGEIIPVPFAVGDNSNAS